MAIVATTAADPVQRVSRRWIASVSLANLGLFMAYFGPLGVLLPNQVQDIAGPRKVLAFGLVTGLGALVAVVANPLAGALSDRTVSRLGRRRPWTLHGALASAAALALLAGQQRRRLVVISGIVMAVPASMLALWPTWPVVVAAAAVLGLGFGVYLSVDQALITQVLPAADGHGRDLGVISVASSAGQALAPAIAAPVVTYLGGYPVLYFCVAVIVLLGSAAVSRIRSVP